MSSLFDCRTSRSSHCALSGFKLRMQLEALLPSRLTRCLVVNPRPEGKTEAKSSCILRTYIELFRTRQLIGIQSFIKSGGLSDVSFKLRRPRKHASDACLRLLRCGHLRQITHILTSQPHSSPTLNSRVPSSPFTCPSSDDNTTLYSLIILWTHFNAEKATS